MVADSCTLGFMSTAEKLHGMRVGHLQLLTQAESSAGNDPSSPIRSNHDSSLISINLVDHLDKLDKWIQQGALLALRVLVPCTPLTLEERNSVDMVAAGAGSEFAAIVGTHLGFGEIKTLGDGSADVDSRRATFHRALFGCAGKVPKKEELLALLSLLRHDGQLSLFGLPIAQITSVQRALSNSGFSTRAAGAEGELGFLSGSIENLAHFRAKGSLGQ